MNGVKGYYAAVTMPKIMYLPGTLIFGKMVLLCNGKLRFALILDIKFLQRWIGKGGSVPWPLRSLDLIFRLLS